MDIMDLQAADDFRALDFAAEYSFSLCVSY